MSDYASLQDFATYTGQTIDPTLGQMLLDTATAAVDSHCRRSFQLNRHSETHYGNDGNVLMLRKYPVQQVNSVKVVMPGSLAFNIPVTQLLVQPEVGKVTNYTPLMFQTYGYTAVFPGGIPILVDYSFGPYATVYGDTSTADASYKVYTFTNKNWFATAPINVYKNGVLLTIGVDYTIDMVNGKVTLTNDALSTDVITADYWYWSVPQEVKLATLMIATKQLNLPKSSKMFYASQGDTDFKVQYDIQTALTAFDGQIEALLKRHVSKGVW